MPQNPKLRGLAVARADDLSTEVDPLLHQHAVSSFKHDQMGTIVSDWCQTSDLDLRYPDDRRSFMQAISLRL